MLVEAAFILPVLLLVVFGIVEYGLVFKDSLTVSAATRAGARAASARPHAEAYLPEATAAVTSALRAALPDESIEYLTVYRADPSDGSPFGGTSDDFTTCATSCQVFAWRAGAWADVGGSWTFDTQMACASTGTDDVGVFVQARHPWVTGLLPGKGPTLREHAVMRFEPLPTEACP